MPDDFTGIARVNMHHVGLVVLHVRKFGHHGGMFRQFAWRADHHFVQHAAPVLDDEMHGVAFLHGERVRRETHGIGHDDGDRAGDLRGPAGDAPGGLLGDGVHGRRVLLLAMRLSGQGRGHRQQCDQQQSGFHLIS